MAELERERGGGGMVPPDVFCEGSVPPHALQRQEHCSDIRDRSS